MVYLEHGHWNEEDNLNRVRSLKEWKIKSLTIGESPII